MNIFFLPVLFYGKIGVKKKDCHWTTRSRVQYNRKEKDTERGREIYKCRHQGGTKGVN